MYDKPLIKVLAAVAIVSLTLEYFPTRFRYVEIIILTKLEKIGKILYILGAYKPIALLNSINKIIEKIMGERIAVATKKYNLLSQSQIENRLGRLIKLAIRIIIDAIYIA
jgi:hypothetical protein